MPKTHGLFSFRMLWLFPAAESRSSRKGFILVQTDVSDQVKSTIHHLTPGDRPRMILLVIDLG
jgi:hypothetical protein